MPAPTLNQLNHASRINWWLFKHRVRGQWEIRERLKKQLHLSGPTIHRAWHGESIGLVPFLRICEAMGANPLYFLKAEKES